MDGSGKDSNGVGVLETMNRNGGKDSNGVQPTALQQRHRQLRVQPIEEEVEEDEPDPRYHKDKIQAHLGETFVGFEFERPVLPEGYIWAPGNFQGQYILIKEEITAELYGDRQQGTHATTPAVAGAANNGAAWTSPPPWKNH